MSPSPDRNQRRRIFRLGHRWRSALKGFVLCNLCILGLYLVMHLGAYALAANAGQLESALGVPIGLVRASLIEHAQLNALETAKLLALLNAIYWGVAAFAHLSSDHRTRLVHTLMILGVFFLLTVSANAYFAWADTHCDVLPYPHQGFQLAKIRECPSSSTFFTILSATGLLLIISSFLARLASRD